MEMSCMLSAVARRSRLQNLLSNATSGRLQNLLFVQYMQLFLPHLDCVWGTYMLRTCKWNQREISGEVGNFCKTQDTQCTCNSDLSSLIYELRYHERLLRSVGLMEQTSQVSSEHLLYCFVSLPGFVLMSWNLCSVNYVQDPQADWHKCMLVMHFLFQILSDVPLSRD